ncbi:MAG: response regulator transcription factor [Gemmatimonadota bacterium]|nr:response regulator transcription factor [Gemmatimonadota bacterium]MDE3128434.1 response regulator transcription factor [Gemmatimonadota bacterium]MDE3171582.1 response regulator transcription factor [Gemmatimonadota bacterium]MDE3216347.1 response regulator transcription factor [Gemmatimonadota bacterium]
MTQPAAQVPAPVPQPTLLVIEDEQQIRRAVRNALHDITDHVLEVATGREGIDQAAAAMPDLIVLDLGLPDMAGAEVCREVRRWGTMPIVVLSARHGEDEKVNLLNLGADDYITKPFSTQEFSARVRAQLRRFQSLSAPSHAASITVDGLTIDLVRRRVSRGSGAIHLTPIEWDILRTLATASGRTLTHQQIFDAVWGRAFGNPQQYLRVHITNLRRKIERDPSRPQLIITEPGVGYRFESLE